MSTIYCSKFAKRFTAMMLKRIMEWDLSKLRSISILQRWKPNFKRNIKVIKNAEYWPDIVL